MENAKGAREVARISETYSRVYYRPTDLLSLPLLISVVFLIYKQNNARLNFGSPAAQFTLPHTTAQGAHF
jgi:hypothetical protein